MTPHLCGNFLCSINQCYFNCCSIPLRAAFAGGEFLLRDYRAWRNAEGGGNRTLRRGEADVRIKSRRQCCLLGKNPYFCINQDIETELSNWGEQQKSRQETKEKNKTRREKLAGYFFDLSKLTFAGLVVGSVTPLFMDTLDAVNWGTLILGGFVTCAFAFFANRILK